MLDQPHGIPEARVVELFQRQLATALGRRVEVPHLPDVVLVLPLPPQAVGHVSARHQQQQPHERQAEVLADVTAQQSTMTCA